MICWMHNGVTAERFWLPCGCLFLENTDYELLYLELFFSKFENLSMNCAENTLHNTIHVLAICPQTLLMGWSQDLKKI